MVHAAARYKMMGIWKAVYRSNSCFKTIPKRKSPDTFCLVRDLLYPFFLSPLDTAVNRWAAVFDSGLFVTELRSQTVLESKQPWEMYREDNRENSPDSKQG